MAEGIVIVTLGRVDGHASIFIDYQYILVLIHNGRGSFTGTIFPESSSSGSATSTVSPALSR
ncbi:MAG: hypothetical protein ACLR0U_18875 [Enterocloster clostridioformis]